MVGVKKMADFKEINDLGLEISKQYAVYDQIREKSGIDSASIVRQKIQVDTQKPFLTSNASVLFQLEKRNLPFGETEPPKNFYGMQNRAFVYNLIPSIGNIEQIENMRYLLEEKGKELETSGQEVDIEELNQLKSFTQLLYHLERDFTHIENERNRLQRG
jgi:hypothetical protein